MVDMSEFGEAAPYLRKSEKELMKVQTVAFDGELQAHNPLCCPGLVQGLHTNVVKEMQSKAGCKTSLVTAVLLLEVAGSTKFGFLYSAKLLRTLR